MTSFCVISGATCSLLASVVSMQPPTTSAVTNVFFITLFAQLNDNRRKDCVETLSSFNLAI